MDPKVEKELNVDTIKALRDELISLGHSCGPDDDVISTMSLRDLKAMYAQLKEVLRSIPR